MARFSLDPVASQRLELKSVNAYESHFAKSQLKAETARLRALVQEGTTLKEIRPQAYALARVAAERVLHKRPFDSQVLGALSLDSGNIAQMGTGEGKTLTALMPLYLNALTGKGSHLITVNDYLARAGYDELKPVFEELGVSAGLVLKDTPADQKRAAYAADVTYVSNDTLGFDYLGDRTVRDPRHRVQREPNFALIDEVDQVLLDEARVPLIIAGQESEQDTQVSADQGQFFQKIVEGLVPGEDYRVDRKMHSAFLTEVGEQVVANEVALTEMSPEDPDYKAKLAAGTELRTLLREEAKLTQGENELPPELAAQRGLKKIWSQLLGRPTETEQSRRLEEIQERKEELWETFPGVNLYAEDQMHRVRFLQNALQARGLFRLGRDYTVENGEVQIIDEFKGRISEGRRFTQGLHQALEIKEGLSPKPETHTVASITYPNLFRRYQAVAGMTGTAESAKKEFGENLGLNVVVVPPNKERQRVDHPDRIFATREEKFAAVVEDARKYFEEGIPVLVATRSVEMNQYVSALLDSQGIPNQSLNAQDVKTNTPEENIMIAMAGQSGVITVATNMAGRGVDIKPDSINYKKLAIQCETLRQEGKAVVVEFDPEKANDQMDRLINWFQLPEGQENDIPFSKEGAPKAGTVRLSSGPLGDAAGAVVLKAEDFPGRKLVVLATERNLDARIDDQLRGRAGRQGAPGETQFYVSLEDDLMRIYGDEDREKLKEMLVQGKTKKIRAQVDEAQQSVENLQADGRMQTAKYDQIANMQREIVWGFRDQWVNSRPDLDEVSGETRDIKGTVTDFMVEAFLKAMAEDLGDRKRVKPDKLEASLKRVGEQFGFPLKLEAGDGPWKERVDKGIRSRLQQLDEEIHANLTPGLDKNMLEFYQWQSLLESLDEGWKNQLEALEDEKQGANLEAYAQKEPEQAYKERAFKAFGGMWDFVRAETARKVMPQMVEAAEVLRKPKAP